MAAKPKKRGSSRTGSQEGRRAGRTRNRNTTKQVKFTTTKANADALEALAKEGHYGNNVAEVVDFFVKQGLKDELLSRRQTKPGGTLSGT